MFCTSKFKIKSCFVCVLKKIFKLLKTMLYTPLVLLQIILLFSIKLFCFDFSITNLVLVNFLILFFFDVVVAFFSSKVNHLREISFF